MSSVTDKLGGLGGTVNEELLSRAVRHAVMLQRLSTDEVRRMLAILDREVLPDLVARVHSRMSRIASRGFDTGFTTTQRYRDMTTSINTLVDEAMRDLYARTKAEMRDVAAGEAASQRAILEDEAGAFGLEFELPSQETLASIVTSRPMDGHLLRDWFGKLSTRTKKAVQRQVNVGIVEGDSVSAIVDRLTGTPGVASQARNGLSSIVRTAVNHVTTHAREATFGANDDLIDGVQFVATLDDRTTPICRSLDGKVFPVGEGPRPPLHFNCRSTTVPVLKSWKQLGIRLGEAPEGTRAALSGEVPDSTTYAEWLNDQDVETQNEALGTGIAELWRQGRISLEDTVSRNGSGLSLLDILKAEGVGATDVERRALKQDLIAAGMAAEDGQ